jgi:amidase
MNVADLSYKSARELSQLLAAREVSAVELTLAAISRIDQFDSKINAICVCDFERALDAARKADRARASGDQHPLLGLPMTIKESFNVAGLTTTWGMPPYRDFKPAQDALAVGRLKSAGAVILGKTNIPFALGDLQTYNDLYGTTNNPWDASRTAGGSSGGSAAALAAGYGALSLGSDIAGSLRVPAHFCGVYAHKPTFGLLPTRGHTPPSAPALPTERDLTVIGPMARSAGDLALMLDVLQKPDEKTLGIAYRLAPPSPRHESLSSYRVLVIDTHPLMPVDKRTRSALHKLADRLARCRVKVLRDNELMPDPVNAARLYMRLLFSSLSASWPMGLYEDARSRAMKLDRGDLSLAAERVRGAVLSHREWLAANAERMALRERWENVFKTFDLVLCPVSPTSAFAHDHDPDQFERRILVDHTSVQYADQLVWSGVATTPGLPVTVAPMGGAFGVELPIGVQIIGGMYQDRTTIRFAELMEREFGGFVPPPLSEK